MMLWLNQFASGVRLLVYKRQNQGTRKELKISFLAQVDPQIRQQCDCLLKDFRLSSRIPSTKTIKKKKKKRWCICTAPFSVWNLTAWNGALAMYGAAGYQHTSLQDWVTSVLTDLGVLFRLPQLLPKVSWATMDHGFFPLLTSTIRHLSQNSVCSGSNLPKKNSSFLWWQWPPLECHKRIVWFPASAVSSNALLFCYMPWKFP